LRRATKTVISTGKVAPLRIRDNNRVRHAIVPKIKIRAYFKTNKIVARYVFFFGRFLNAYANIRIINAILRSLSPPVMTKRYTAIGVSVALARRYKLTTKATNPSMVRTVSGTLVGRTFSFRVSRYDRITTFRWIRNVYPTVVRGTRSRDVKHLFFRRTITRHNAYDRNRRDLRTNTILIFPVYPPHVGIPIVETGEGGRTYLLYIRLLSNGPRSEIAEKS